MKRPFFFIWGKFSISTLIHTTHAFQVLFFKPKDRKF